MESYEALVHSGFAGGKPDVSRADVLAWLIRRNGLEMSRISRGSHIGSVFSVAEIIAVLYTGVLRVDPKNPQMPDRDRLILSKGHAGSAVYAALAETGFFPVEQLKNHYGNGSVLSGHVTHKGVPGAEVSTGSSSPTISSCAIYTMLLRSVTPGLTHMMHCCSSVYCSVYSSSSGRGPTKLISPFRMLNSWGSSSSFSRRIIRPARVTRLSFLAVHPPVLSASTTMLRNL